MFVIAPFMLLPGCRRSQPPASKPRWRAGRDAEPAAAHLGAAKRAGQLVFLHCHLSLVASVFAISGIPVRIKNCRHTCLLLVVLFLLLFLSPENLKLIVRCC